MALFQFASNASAPLGRSRRIALAVVAGAVFAALASAVPSAAAPPGDDGSIVYTTTDGIYTVGANGSGSKLVKAGGYLRPDVSPDGKSVLVVQGTDMDPTGPLLSIDLTTGATTTIVATDVTSGVWSGDGSKIAYADASGLWTKSGQSSAVKVANGYTDVYDWSPVDNRVLAQRSVSNGGFPSVYFETVDVVTKAAVVIEDNGPGLFTWYSRDGDFSPDGEDVVYVSSSPGYTDVRIAGNPDPLDEAQPWGGPGGPVAWSPDGGHIVYATYVLNEDMTAGVAVLAVHDVVADTRITFPAETTGVDWQPVITLPPDEPFRDVAKDNVFYADILWLADRGITRGCNPPANDLFCPDAFVTRGQMAAFLVRALGLTERLDNPFTDDDGSIFEADIERLAAAGITRGCNPPVNDRFCPDQRVTREQMAAFLVRALGLTERLDNPFTDDDGSIFEADIERLAAAGVTRGCNPPANTLFCPSAYVTRGQMAAFLHRALG